MLTITTKKQKGDIIMKKTWKEYKKENKAFYTTDIEKIEFDSLTIFEIVPNWTKSTAANTFISAGRYFATSKENAFEQVEGFKKRNQAPTSKVFQRRIFRNKDGSIQWSSRIGLDF